MTLDSSQETSSISSPPERAVPVMIETFTIYERSRHLLEHSYGQHNIGLPQLLCSLSAWAEHGTQPQGMLKHILQRLPSKNLPILKSAFRSFAEQLIQIEDAWWSQTTQEMNEQTPGIISGDKLNKESKISWGIAMAELTDLYIQAIHSGNDSPRHFHAEQFSTLLDQSAQILETKHRGKEMMERNSAAKAQAAIAILFEQQGFIVLRPNYKEPSGDITTEEIELWEPVGADMIAFGPQGETFIIDAKGRFLDRIPRIERNFTYQPDKHDPVIEQGQNHLRNNPDKLRSFYRHTYDPVVNNLGTTMPIVFQLYVPTHPDHMSPVGQVSPEVQREISSIITTLSQEVTETKPHAPKHQRNHPRSR